MQQFKVGDWLQVIAGNERPIGSLFKVKSCLTRYRAADVKLWEPNEGEWCWIGKNLSKIVTHDRDGYFTCLNSNGTYTAYMELEYIYKIAEPFIGELPTFLQH